jgi:tol-pal system protein YbgF
MFKTKNFFISFFLILVITFYASNNSRGEENDITKILQTIQKLQGDIETLEKAVYSSDSSTQSNATSTLGQNDEDALTRHLLKLNEIEEQFQNLTNQFEEINFKIDKLSNRITKIQSDNQMRFQDLERGNLNQDMQASDGEQKKLPGSTEPQDLGSVADSDIDNLEKVQKTQSIETTGAVVTEESERAEKLLPNTNPEEQYKFATSFIKVGDYETAELALREFVDTNGTHELAGNAQYWYGETFRIRQLYVDAATAYLDGYQKYPKSSKAPINLLKLGVTLVNIGEKEQGCSMIMGVSSQYPKANQSVIQKAEYEKKKFKCGEKS